MRITIDFIPHKMQRYDTVGDWQFDGSGNLSIKVSDLGSDRASFLVAIHELIEASLCRFHIPEITGWQVDKFDMGAGRGLTEPGMDPRAPYYNQHLIAYSIEIILSQFFGVEWNYHEEKINSL